jgi:hypothetical protein
MNMHVEAGGFPYLPSRARVTRRKWDEIQTHVMKRGPTPADLAAFVANRTMALLWINRGIFVDPPPMTAAITTAAHNAQANTLLLLKDKPSVAHSWDRAIAEETEFNPFGATLTTIQADRTAMDNIVSLGNFAHGLGFSRKTRAWNDLAVMTVDNTLPVEILRNIEGRYNDLYDVVMDFVDDFGVFFDPAVPLIPQPNPLTAEYCQRLVRHIRTRKNRVIQGMWSIYRECVLFNLTAAQALQEGQRDIARQRLRLFGFEKVPHLDTNLFPPIQTQRDMAVALGFDQGRVDVPGNWTFHETAGSGSWGHAGLWVERDLQGLISNRIVVKESYLRDGFNKHNYWVGNTCRRVVKEENITRYLTRLPNSSNIVRSEAYGVYEKLNMYRV